MNRLVAGVLFGTSLGCGWMGGPPRVVPGTPPPVPQGKVEAPVAQAWTCDPEFYDGLPEWAQRIYHDRSSYMPVARHRTLVPQVLEGDFDGDGALDVAIPVQTCEGDQVGVAVLFREPKDPALFGMGEEGKDLSWLDYWFVTHDPNTPDLLDLGERCTIGAPQPLGELQLDCSS